MIALPTTIAQELAPYVAVVGVDWADQKHDVIVHALGSNQIEHGQVDHTPKSLENWVLGLRERFGGQVAVAVESSRGPLLFALMKYEFITVFPIPPGRFARYREAFTSSGAKDDSTDAEASVTLRL